MNAKINENLILFQAVKETVRSANSAAHETTFQPPQPQANESADEAPKPAADISA